MKLFWVIILMLAAVAAICLIHRKEGMGGYGTLSGLYFNNNGNIYCWENPYEPGFQYCGVSSKVNI